MFIGNRVYIPGDAEFIKENQKLMETLLQMTLNKLQTTACSGGRLCGLIPALSRVFVQVSLSRTQDAQTAPDEHVCISYGSFCYLQVSVKGD